MRQFQDPETFETLIDHQAERDALLSFIVHPLTFADSSTLLAEPLFTNPDSLALFRALRAIHADTATPDLGIETVARQLERMGHSTAEASRMMMEVMKGTASLNPSATVAWLAELALRRQTLQTAIELSMQARSVAIDPADMIENARRALDRAEQYATGSRGEIITLADAFTQLKHLIVENQQGTSTPGSPTGLSELDGRGGLLPGHLVIIGGKTSQGKSSLATNVCVNALRHGHPTSYYTLEMTAREEAARIVASMTGIDTSRLLNQPLSDSEANRVKEAVESIDGRLMYFDQSVASTPEDIIRSIRHMHRHHGIQGAVVDFLQRLSVPRGTNREQATAEAVKQFKNVAKELGIWIVVLSQISRGTNQAEPPSLAGLRDSGQIEEAADEVWLVYRPEVYRAHYPEPFTHITTKGTAMIKIAKGRNTGTGEFVCRFNPATCSFSDLPASLIQEPDDQRDVPF